MAISSATSTKTEKYVAEAVNRQVRIHFSSPFYSIEQLPTYLSSRLSSFFSWQGMHRSARCLNLGMPTCHLSHLNSRKGTQSTEDCIHIPLRMPTFWSGTEIANNSQQEAPTPLQFPRRLAHQAMFYLPTADCNPPTCL